MFLGFIRFGIIAEHFNLTGIEAIREETRVKAQLLYKCLEQNQFVKPFVKELRWRSQTVITVDSGSRTREIIDLLAERGLIVGQGYGKLKEEQFRAANFSAHSLESFEMLCSVLMRLS